MAQRHDAVLVLPGAMGSELRGENNDLLWGFAWRTAASGHLLRHHKQLWVTEDDLAGKPRIRATGLLRTTAFLSFLGGMEPYTGLVTHLQDQAVDPRAVDVFPYDWRLAVDYNAGLLVTAAQQHLETWRAVVVKEFGKVVDPADVRLVLVAHSMGGLVAWNALQSLGLHELVRGLVTLGTPFYGSLNALLMLRSGEEAPHLTSRVAARDLARTCPGAYDLLPSFDCVVEGPITRPLTPDDVAAVGGNRTFAEQAWARRLDPDLQLPHRPVSHSVLAGSDQPTNAAINAAGGLTAAATTKTSNGDGTVLDTSAVPPGREAFYLPQQHGALAQTAEGQIFARKRMQGQGMGSPLAVLPVGVDIEDTLAPGPAAVRVTGIEAPAQVTVTSTNLTDNSSGYWTAQWREGEIYFTGQLAPGLHRIWVSQAGYSPVSKIVLAEAGGQRE